MVVYYPLLVSSQFSGPWEKPHMEAFALRFYYITFILHSMHSIRLLRMDKLHIPLKAKNNPLLPLLTAGPLAASP